MHAWVLSNSTHARTDTLHTHTLHTHATLTSGYLVICVAHVCMHGLHATPHAGGGGAHTPSRCAPAPDTSVQGMQGRKGQALAYDGLQQAGLDDGASDPFSTGQNKVGSTPFGVAGRSSHLVMVGGSNSNLQTVAGQAGRPSMWATRSRASHAGKPATPPSCSFGKPRSLENHIASTGRPLTPGPPPLPRLMGPCAGWPWGVRGLPARCVALRAAGSADAASS